jgi:hypothetical protein
MGDIDKLFFFYQKSHNDSKYNRSKINIKKMLSFVFIYENSLPKKHLHKISP